MSAPIDDRIKRFEFYMRTRVLRIAEILACHFDSAQGELSESGFFILSGVSSYFEMINQFLTGESSERDRATGRRGRSTDFFIAGFKTVFPCTPLTEDDIRNLYGVLRCGMYHSGMPKGYTLLDRNETQAIRKGPSPQEIVINPAQLVRDIKMHFESYIADLKNPTNTNLRDAFNDMAQEIESTITMPSVPTPGEPTPAPMAPGQTTGTRPPMLPGECTWIARPGQA